MEPVRGSVDTFVNQHTRLAIQVGKTLYVEPGQAAFLLPADLRGIDRLQSMAQTDRRGAIALANVDDNHMEVCLRGTWIATDATSDSGIFVTMLPPATEKLIYRLWRNS